MVVAIAKSYSYAVFVLLLDSGHNLPTYLRNIVDLPCQPGFNSLDGGDCSHGGHYADDLVAN